MDIPKMFLVGLNFLFGLSGVTMAYASHRVEEIGLDQVVDQSHWICLAEYLGKDKGVSAAYRFRISDSLLNRLSQPSVPQEVSVITPLAAANGMAESAWKSTGVRRTPLVYQLSGGTKMPSSIGEKQILFLREYDSKVYVLVAQDAILPTGKRDRVLEEIQRSEQRVRSAQKNNKDDLIFLGKVESIEISPMKPPVYNYVVKTKVLRVLQGSFTGNDFSFRIHSPSKSQIKVGDEIQVRAQPIENGYWVDPDQVFSR